MHRTNRIPQTALGILLLSIVLEPLGAGLARAADEPVLPTPRTVEESNVVLPLGSTQRLQMKGRKNIKTAKIAATAANVIAAIAKPFHRWDGGATIAGA